MGVKRNKQDYKTAPILEGVCLCHSEESLLYSFCFRPDTIVTNFYHTSLRLYYFGLTLVTSPFLFTGYKVYPLEVAPVYGGEEKKNSVLEYLWCILDRVQTTSWWLQRKKKVQEAKTLVS